MKDVGGWKLAFSRRDDGHLQQGVGVMLLPRAAPAYIDSQLTREGVLLVKLMFQSSIVRVFLHTHPPMFIQKSRKTHSSSSSKMHPS